MNGLQKICKQYGSMTVNGQRYVWNYSENAPVLESDMPISSERWRESEKAKWRQAQEQNQILRP